MILGKLVLRIKSHSSLAFWKTAYMSKAIYTLRRKQRGKHHAINCKMNMGHKNLNFLNCGDSSLSATYTLRVSSKI